MQVTEADDKNVRRVGVEEELIKFRPSPNFKNMKKFLKSRSDYNETSIAVNQAVAAAVAVEMKPTLDRKEVKPVVVQPPLPPYPPPPDSPPNLNIVIKQEREDDEVQDTSVNEGEIPHEPRPTIEVRPVEQILDRPKKTICKEFIRGNCKRPLCKYAHEVDVSQLKGVFTFCWNYQNAVCTFPSCRFVHASVFEEAEFYRTGVLPPHARNHLKKQQAPPPQVPIQETPQEIRVSNFANPPPVHTNVENPLPVISCVPASAIKQRPDENYRAAVPRRTSPLKREWAEIEDFSSSPRDLDVNEHLAKKCKNCEFLDFSTKYQKEMIHDLIQSSEEINKKMSLLNKKSSKLFNVLFTLWKSATTKTADKENNSVMEQLNNFIGANNRIGSSSANNDDSLKNIFSLMGGGNTSLSSLMKLLYTSGDQTLTSESPRDIIARDLNRG